MAVGSFKELYLRSLKINDKLAELLAQDFQCPGTYDCDYKVVRECNRSCGMGKPANAEKCWIEYANFLLARAIERRG